jgi:DNA topoisomerase-1
MQEYFSSIIDYDFSANLELKLDAVSDGETEWKELIASFYEIFKKTLTGAEDALKDTRIKVPEEVTEEISGNGAPAFP